MDMLGGRFDRQFASLSVQASLLLWILIVAASLLGPPVMVEYVRNRMREMPSFFRAVGVLKVVMMVSVVLVPLSIFSYAVWLRAYGGGPGPLITFVNLGKWAYDEPVYMGLLVGIALLTLSWYFRVHYRLLLYWAASTVSLFLSRLMFELHAVVFGTPPSINFSPFIIFAGFLGLLALVFFWVAFSSLFHHYAERIGRKFWMIVFAPAIPSFGILFVPFGGQISLVLFTTGFLASGTVWAIGFYLISRKLSDRLVKSFFVSTAFGQILTMISTQSIIFPKALETEPAAFGVVSALFIVPGGIFFFWGLYAMSRYVGIDESIRREVRKSLSELKELRLVREISDAEFLRQVETRVFDVARSLERQTGMREDLADQEVRYYLDLALGERRTGGSRGAVARPDLN